MLRLWAELINILLFVLLAAFVDIFAFSNDGPPMVITKELSSFQDKAIDISLEMNRFIAAFSIGLIGVLGGLLMPQAEKDKLKQGLRLLLLNSMLFSCWSMYFGYLHYFKTLELISHNAYSGLASTLIVPMKWQYYLFCVSVLLFGLFVALRASDGTVPRCENEENV